MYYTTFEQSTPNCTHEIASCKTSASTNIVENNIEHNNVLITGTVDAAVTVSVQQFYHSILSTSCPLQVSQVLQSIKTASGAHVAVEGMVAFNITLGQVSYKCNAYVIAGLSYSVVLGRDFLGQNRAIIDLGAQTVEFFENNVIPSLDGKGPSMPASVRCEQT